MELAADRQCLVHRPVMLYAGMPRRGGVGSEMVGAAATTPLCWMAWRLPVGNSSKLASSQKMLHSATNNVVVDKRRFFWQVRC